MQTVEQLKGLLIEALTALGEAQVALEQSNEKLSKIHSESKTIVASQAAAKAKIARTLIMKALKD